MEGRVILYHVAVKQCALNLTSIPSLHGQFGKSMPGPENLGSFKVGSVFLGHALDEGLLESAVHRFTSLMTACHFIAVSMPCDRKFNTFVPLSKITTAAFATIAWPKSRKM